MRAADGTLAHAVASLYIHVVSSCTFVWLPLPAVCCAVCCGSAEAKAGRQCDDAMHRAIVLGPDVIVCGTRVCTLQHPPLFLLIDKWPAEKAEPRNAVW
jgi:hypothetical protein